MLADRYDLSRRGSVSIAVRMPRERAEKLREAAVTSGIDVSTYMRDALFAAPTLTIGAVNKIHREAAAAARELAEAQMQPLRDQVAQALAGRARAREQLATLEGDLEQGPLRLLVLSRRVLRGETDAREQFAEVWGHLDPPAQEHLVPAMIMAIREFLLAIPPAKSSSYDLARQRRVVADVDWLLTRLAGAPEGSTPGGPESVNRAPPSPTAPTSALARAEATEDPIAGSGPAPPSQSQVSATLYESYPAARSTGPKTDVQGRVAGDALLGSVEGIAADWVLQAPADPVWTSAIVVDVTALSATSGAAKLGRAGASTSARVLGGSGGEHSEVERKGWEEYPAEDPPAPRPVETHQSAEQLSRGRISGRSKASADMWL